MGRLFLGAAAFIAALVFLGAFTCADCSDFMDPHMRGKEAG